MYGLNISNNIARLRRTRTKDDSGRWKRIKWMTASAFFASFEKCDMIFSRVRRENFPVRYKEQ